jgi:hypothetical protein
MMHKRYNHIYSEVWLHVAVITSLKLISGKCCHICMREYHVLFTVTNELSQEHNWVVVCYTPQSRLIITLKSHHIWTIYSKGYMTKLFKQSV